jgi:FkbM family methyltransferase
MSEMARESDVSAPGAAGTIHSPTAEDALAALMRALPDAARHHATDSAIYQAFAVAARQAVVASFGPDQRQPVQFGPFGPISFPYRSMGTIDTLDLFGLDELIIFAFYWANRGLYSRIADIGANIGLHTLIMSRCGFEVTSFEPDPRHVEIMQENLKRNGVPAAKIVASAVSDKAGTAEFVRVLGNTTGSHLAGAKHNPYGKLDRFGVSLVPFSDIIAGIDFAKIDAEGHEAVLVTSVQPDQWHSTDVMLEIGSEENAGLIFDYVRRTGINIFTQRNGWSLARTAADLPTSHKHGSAFITRRDAVPGMSI